MKKLKIVDLFCGSGGFTLGFLKENYDVILAADHDDYCKKVFSLNLPKIRFEKKDLKKIDRDFFKNYSPDVVVGGPPCQGFSTIGSRASSNKKKRIAFDPRNNLVYSFIDHVEFLRPKIFLMENVQGLITRDKGSIYNILKKKIRKIGYTFNTFLLDAVDYGVPQFRKRTFILGSSDKSIDLSPPEQTHSNEFLGKKHLTINSFIKDLANISDDPEINHVSLKHKSTNLKRYKLIPEGGRLPENKLDKEIYRKNFGNTFKRLHRNKPALTMVPGHNAFPIHPWLDRSLTVREAARLQTYPDNFIFVGPRHEQCIQVGNSVPVVLARVWARHIKRIFKVKKKNNYERAA